MYDNYSEIYNDTLLHDEPRSLGVKVTLQRAQQLARLKWVPRKNVPRVGNGGEYLADKEYIGIPYSLVMHVNTYVGLDVSLYTFLTAVSNPYSVLYTEDVREAPYNGVECAPYYGTVCSTAVWYALGINIPYFTRFVPTLDFMITPDYSDPDDIMLCDVLLSPGHMVMVYDIARRKDGQIEKVTLFECATTYVEDTKFITYTFDVFKQRWAQSGWKIFRYEALDDNTTYEHFAYVAIDGGVAEPFSYNNSICTTKGDKVAYREGEVITINIFDKSFSDIELYKDGVIYLKKKISGKSVEFRSLPYGDYKACLTKESKFSDYVYFEILNVDVTVTNNGQIVTTFHSNNATPEYMDICTAFQSPQAYYPISDEAIIAKQIIVPPVMKEEPLYCKVYFRGKYGRVSNIPLLIE